MANEADDGKSYRIGRTEQMLFERHPTATHFRYPYVYGPRQLAPREWCVIRRILDHRPFLVLPDDGLSLIPFGYVDNLAHAMLLAIDQPEASMGEIFNCRGPTRYWWRNSVADFPDLGYAEESGYGKSYADPRIAADPAQGQYLEAYVAVHAPSTEREQHECPESGSTTICRSLADTLWTGGATLAYGASEFEALDALATVEVLGGFRCSIAFTITGAEIRPD